MMATATSRKTCCCAFCQNSNLSSICSACVNYRLNEYNCNLRSLKSRRDALYSKLTQVQVAKVQWPRCQWRRELKNALVLTGRLRYKGRAFRSHHYGIYI